MTETIKYRGVVIIMAAVFLLSARPCFTQLVLNEVMSYNITFLQDQFNEYSDWLEVYNSGTENEDLENYWLSDERLFLKKWNLPASTLQPNEYKVYFASGRNIGISESYWHTIIDLGDEWKYYIPETNIGSTWRSSTSATLTWASGQTGIGYSDGDDATVISSGTITLYMQRTFSLDEVSEVNMAALYMDYDDGFIAYLNGTEIARSANMGSYGDEFAYNETALANREAIMYNGSDPEMYDFSNNLDLLQPGENILAIEVHNVSSSSSDMSAIPLLLMGFTKVQDQFEPGNEHVVTNTVFPHTNFKIASSGETIYLSD
ncbi:MAG: hypothetical protein R3356_08735, partial [Eudoraea sp.]|nr:hypothetical protein [Eudoraea sp.]